MNETKFAAGESGRTLKTNAAIANSANNTCLFAAAIPDVDTAYLTQDVERAGPRAFDGQRSIRCWPRPQLVDCEFFHLQLRARRVLSVWFQGRSGVSEGGRYDEL